MTQETFLQPSLNEAVLRASSRVARSGVILVLICTVLGAGAQILMKAGGNSLASYPMSEILTHPWLLLKNLPLFSGYCLLGLSTGLMVLALRHGELSILYPIIALTYVWVLILSAVIFHESLNFWKIAAVMTIVTGVGVLGKDSRR